MLSCHFWKDDNGDTGTTIPVHRINDNGNAILMRFFCCSFAYIRSLHSHSTCCETHSQPTNRRTTNWKALFPLYRFSTWAPLTTDGATKLQNVELHPGHRAVDSPPPESNAFRDARSRRVVTSMGFMVIEDDLTSLWDFGSNSSNNRTDSGMEICPQLTFHRPLLRVGSHNIPPVDHKWRLHISNWSISERCSSKNKQQLIKRKT